MRVASSQAPPISHGQAGARLCPGCREADPIRGDAAAWPLAWACPACGLRPRIEAAIPILAPDLADTDQGFDPRDFAILARTETDHFWFVARRRLILWLAGRFASTAKSFIEIGCGGGNVLAALAAERQWDRIVGSEIHPSGLAFARERLSAGEVELVQFDARAIPFRGAFDLVGAFDVLEHIEADETVIAGVAGALRDDGVFIAAVPQHPALWSSADDLAHHVRRYRRGELERKLRANGFEILFSSSFTSLLLPLMALSRLTVRRNRAGADARAQANAEFEISPLVNKALGAVMAVETFLTFAGMRWPAGGSRVVVGRKTRPRIEEGRA